MQRPAHRDAGVLEAGEMNDAGDGVFGENLIEELTVQDAARIEGNVRAYEASMPARQVVDNDGRNAVGREGPYHVRTDVPGSAGHQPRHRCLLSPASGYRGRTRRSVILMSRTRSVAAIGSANRSSANTGCGSSMVTSISVRLPFVIVFQLATR